FLTDSAFFLHITCPGATTIPSEIYQVLSRNTPQVLCKIFLRLVIEECVSRYDEIKIRERRSELEKISIIPRWIGSSPCNLSNDWPDGPVSLRDMAALSHL